MALVGSCFDHDISIPKLVPRNVAVNTTTTAATAIRIVRTPWPIVTALMVFSCVLAAFSIRRTAKDIERSRIKYDSRGHTNMKARLPDMPWLIAVIWFINFVRAIVALAYLLKDLIHGKRLPSIGVLITFTSLMANATHIYEGKILYYLGFISAGIAIVGCALYIVNGVLAWLFDANINKSVQLIVTVGCDGNLFTLGNPLDYLCGNLLPTQLIYKVTPGDTAFFVGYYFGVFTLSLVVLFPMIRLCLKYICCAEQFEDYRVDMLQKARSGVFVVAFVGGMFAIISAVLNSQDYDASYLDCSHTKPDQGYFSGCNTTASILVPGGNAGFISIWAQERYDADKDPDSEEEEKDLINAWVDNIITGLER
ncbi:hypothetical protein K432DRAFT_411251 [Lepidopterella palustris CBS 459.81]|uniref:Uncharacterized protein n=1 Tax=Lepidopterella palustris CBS 459.81 TaxID=1314670 RepID=A0A8E2J831_9PEZI|nr:hypothetical protein K432DRAFT_411251 [Lepidopterella palustris CBS 459.81]